jgi:UDP-2,4-diacetamido-2,4,6-trideoxy-beta-L-altropyranose hydrolase
MMLFFRADGGRAIGFGHLMRCHALAQAARRAGLAPFFLTRPGDGTGISKLAALGERAVPLTGPENPTADLTATLGAIRLALRGGPMSHAILVTDHNGLDASWIRGAREAGPVVVSLNDLPRIRYASHLVVNGNLGAERFHYETEAGTRLLVGPAYFFFRDEFLEPGVARCAQPELARRVVVTLGAGDPENVTQRVIEALEGAGGTLEITLVAGGAYGYLESLEGAAAKSRHRVAIERDLPKTARVFASADLAVCAGGTTAYEMAILGVPAVVLILSETQADAARALDAGGVVLCAGTPDVAHILDAVESLRRDAKRRREMAARGRVLFDGQGRRRVLEEAEALRDAQCSGEALA